MTDHFVQRGHHRSGLLAVLPVARNDFSRGGKLIERGETRGIIDGAYAAGKEKILSAIFLMDFVFVGEIIADGEHAEVAGFDKGFDRFDHRWLKGLLLVLRIPGSFLLEVIGIFAEADHGVGEGLVGDADETLRAAPGAASVAINFDEAVGEIDSSIVLDPVGAKFEPIRGIAGLIVAHEIADDFGLARLGEWLSLGEIFVGAFEESGIQARRNLAVGSASATDQFTELA